MPTTTRTTGTHSTDRRHRAGLAPEQGAVLCSVSGPRSRPPTRSPDTPSPNEGRGHPVTLRELGPGEEEVLDEVLAGLSDHSRYLRFHSPIRVLPSVARRALAAIDGRRHVGLVAVAGQRPIGIARYVDLGDGRAELAIEVVDAWQGHGVGTRLASALRERAVAAGYRELVAEVLAENHAVLALLRTVFPVQIAARHGAELTLTLALTDGWSCDAALLLCA